VASQADERGVSFFVIAGGEPLTRPEILDGMRRQHHAVFVAVPWDEEEQGGCLASGCGFVHVSATGDLEPCPSAPYSDANVRKVPLRQALASPFLSAMRDSHQSFTETEGGCALWKNREQVKMLLALGGSVPDAAVQRGHKLQEYLVKQAAHCARGGLPVPLPGPAQRLRFPFVQGGVEGTSQPAHPAEVAEELFVTHRGLPRLLIISDSPAINMKGRRECRPDNPTVFVGRAVRRVREIH
jgi:hypothetical protein